MTWGFTSRKEQDGSTESSKEDAKQQQQLSPSKRNKRRIGGGGRRRGDLDGSSDNNTNNYTAATTKGGESGGNNNQERTNGKKKIGHLNFGRHKQQQHPAAAAASNNEQALRSSRMMNQQQQQQENYVDTSDDGQEIEILLDSPTKSQNQQHHSRRSMSDHKGHRSMPPDSARPSHEHPNNQLVASGMNANNNMKKVSVVSLEKDILVKRTKIYRAQFSVFFPITTRGGSEAAASSRGPRKHRVPLGGRLPRKQDVSYQDVLQMLQNADPVDELSSVRAELKKTSTEIDALEEDKTNLKQRWKALNQQQKPTAGANAGGEQQLNMQLPATMSSGLDGGVDWDIHRLLNSQRKIGLQERLELERMRGRCITVCLQNPRAEDSFLNKCCGAKQPLPPKIAIHGGVAATTMDPTNCRSGGAGASIRHLALLPRGSSFFVSRDNGKSYSWGQLPPRILQRMKKQGLDPVTHCGDLVYLSTGPNGYYYAEFRSGECWWGCAGEDKEFYEILQQWEVYRVVFGSTVTHTTANGKDFVTNSWIILARDGRAAWKNLPLRLHHTLERRLANSAAPAEVALGSGDSYYVRFLDGTADYCLPAEVASACERIQSKGGSITDMAMNPEVSHEFMVRHTELPPR